MKTTTLATLLLLLSSICLAQTNTINFTNGSTGACSFDNQTGVNCEGIVILDANGNNTGYWMNFFIVNAPNGVFPPTYAQLWLGNYQTLLMNAAQMFGGTVTKVPCDGDDTCITVSGNFTDNPMYGQSLFETGTMTEHLIIGDNCFRGRCPVTMINGKQSLSE